MGTWAEGVAWVTPFCEVPERYSVLWASFFKILKAAVTATPAPSQLFSDQDPDPDPNPAADGPRCYADVELFPLAREGGTSREPT